MAEATFIEVKQVSGGWRKALSGDQYLVELSYDALVEAGVRARLVTEITDDPEVTHEGGSEVRDRDGDTWKYHPDDKLWWFHTEITDASLVRGLTFAELELFWGPVEQVTT